MNLVGVLTLLFSAAVSANVLQNVLPNKQLSLSHGGYTCRNQDSIVPRISCFNEFDCQNRYDYSDCQYEQAIGQRICMCRCDYRWNGDRCVAQNIEDTNCFGSSCFFSSGKQTSGTILILTIIILVLVIFIAFFTIPTCALLTCFRSK